MVFQCNRGQRKVQLDRWLGFGGPSIMLLKLHVLGLGPIWIPKSHTEQAIVYGYGSWLLILHYVYQDFPLALKSQHVLQ